MCGDEELFQRHSAAREIVAHSLEDDSGLGLGVGVEALLARTAVLEAELIRHTILLRDRARLCEEFTQLCVRVGDVDIAALQHALHDHFPDLVTSIVVLVRGVDAEHHCHSTEFRWRHAAKLSGVADEPLQRMVAAVFVGFGIPRRRCIRGHFAGGALERVLLERGQVSGTRVPGPEEHQTSDLAIEREPLADHVELLLPEADEGRVARRLHEDEVGPEEVRVHERLASPHPHAPSEHGVVGGAPVDGRAVHLLIDRAPDHRAHPIFVQLHKSGIALDQFVESDRVGDGMEVVSVPGRHGDERVAPRPL